MKTAFVTGGSRGIGLGIAQALLKDGYRVAISARAESSLDRALLDLEDLYPGRVMGVVADVRDFASQKAAVQKIVDTWGRMDILIANAGVGYFADIDEMDPEQWLETIDTNLNGVFFSL